MKKYILIIGVLTLLFFMIFGFFLAGAQPVKTKAKVKPDLTKQLTLKSDSIQLLAKKLRIVESNLTRAKTQLTTKNKQVNGLKSDTAKLNKDIVLKDAMYNECLDSYMQSIGYLQDISFILGDKKGARKKVREIKCTIDKAAE